MIRFGWDERYSVHIPGMDADHRAIFQILAELNTSCLSAADPAMVPAVLEKLDRYADRHLRREELLLRVRGYPRSAEHKAEHDAYRAKVAGLRAHLNAGRQDVAIRTLNFLKEWWTNHITTSDRQYASYFRRDARGRRTPIEPAGPIG